jgi:glycosyltransferase involved in cell wall biosynthesis
MEYLNKFIRDNVFPFKIVIIAEGLLPSVVISIINPLKYFQKFYNISYDVFSIGDILRNRVIVDYDKYDIAIFVRILSRESIDHVLIPFVNLKKKIIYIIDDDFENIDSSTDIGKYLLSLNPKENIKIFCQTVDHVVVSAKSLFERYKQFNNNITIIPGFIDFENINSIVRDKDLKGSTDYLVIGYASSDYNYVNLKPVLSALREILLRYKNKVRFELFFKTIPEELKDLPNVKTIDPISDINEFYKELSKRNWDIGLAPLEDNIFNKSKSNNKYREYSAFGIAGIYTDIEAYNTSVIHNVNGLLTKNTTEGWTSSLENLINDDKKRKSITMLANFDITKNYSVKKVASYYTNIFRSLYKKYRVLILGDYFSITIQVDAIRPFMLLKKLGIIEYDVIALQHLNMNTITNYDIVLFYRVLDSCYLKAMQDMKALGIKTVYSWDDNFFKMPPEVPDFAYCNKLENMASFKGMLSTADLVKVSTDSIYRESIPYNKNVMKCEGTFDFFIIPRILGRKDKYIRIGYFGGPGRDNQFSHVFEALLKIASKYSNVIFEFFGFTPINIDILRNETLKISKENRIFTFPVTYPYEVAIKFLFQRRWDIGLAPLIKDEFNESKANAKYRDYGACHIAGIYTDILTYNTSVTHEVTGLLVNNTSLDWEKAIVRLIEDSSFRRSIADNAYDDIKERFNVTRSAGDWIKIFKSLVGV